MLKHKLILNLLIFTLIALSISSGTNSGQATINYYKKDNTTESKLWQLELENQQLKQEIERLQMLNVKRWNFNHTTGTLIDGFAFNNDYYCIWANGNDFKKQQKVMIHEYYHTQGYKHGEKMDKIVEDKWQNISQCLN